MTKSITILKKRVAPLLDTDPILKIFNVSLSEPLTVEVDFFAEKIYGYFKNHLRSWLEKMGVTAEQSCAELIENKFVLIKEVLLRVMARALSCKELPRSIPDFSHLGVDCTLLENVFHAPLLFAQNKKTIEECQAFMTQAQYLIKCQLRGLIDKSITADSLHPDEVDYWFTQKKFNHYSLDDIINRLELLKGIERIQSKISSAMDMFKWLPALTGILNCDGLIKTISGLRDDCNLAFSCGKLPLLYKEKKLDTTDSLVIPEIQKPKAITKPSCVNLLSVMAEAMPTQFQELIECQKKYNVIIFDAEDFALLQPKTPMHKSSSAPVNLGFPPRAGFF